MTDKINIPATLSISPEDRPQPPSTSGVIVVGSAAELASGTDTTVILVATATR